jgi:hypothetical protein
MRKKTSMKAAKEGSYGYRYFIYIGGCIYTLLHKQINECIMRAKGNSGGSPAESFPNN